MSRKGVSAPERCSDILSSMRLLTTVVLALGASLDACYSLARIRYDDWGGTTSRDEGDKSFPTLEIGSVGDLLL